MSKTKTDVPIAVVDYGAGNLRSVARALLHVGADIVTTSDPAVVCAARAVVFPGVGATMDTMQALHRLGMAAAIHAVVGAGTPLLGICVGMQVLCEVSDEFGAHDCLGIVGGRVRRLPDGQKVPQIGWNQVCYSAEMRAHPLFADIPDSSDFYFVHSFYCDLTAPAMVAGTSDYGVTFPSALIRDNLAAVQFHPEKSGRWGLQLLKNFVMWSEQAAVTRQVSEACVLPPDL